MTPANALGPASDLIYTRLDLPQLPQTDIQALLLWMKDERRKVIDDQGTHQRHMPHQRYPWRAVTVCLDNRWEQSFVAQFPELYSYVGNFPAGAWRKVALLTQLPGEDVFLHTDPDFGIGWRIYLSHGGPRLYFQKFKHRLSERPGTWQTGGPDAIQALCQPERHYVNDVGSYPWALTSVRAAHGVEPLASERRPRITMLLFPDAGTVNHKSHQELLLRSAEIYKDSAIWW